MDDIEKDVVVLAEELVAFVDTAPTAFHATAQLAQELIEVGFEELLEQNEWQLKAGQGYFVQRNGSGLIAFRMGNLAPADAGFRIIGTHTDSPTLKIKPHSECIDGGFAKVGVEVYGGPILNTWLDRNLGLAGKVMVRSEQGTTARLVKIDEPVAIVPNVAIHLNREVNKGMELNAQQHLSALLGPVNDKEGILKSMIADELDVDVDQLGDMDLYLYDTTKACLCGVDESMISSSRLDNLAMCHAVLKAICDSEEAESTSVGIFFDHEEIGSTSPVGANSSFARSVLERVALMENHPQATYRSFAQSMIISADGAHAYHPNYPEKYEPNCSPNINGGPVIKYNANQRYSTTAETAEFFGELCAESEVPVQKVMNRSDIPSGSTIGPVCSAMLGIPSVDVGNAMWAMHSIRETSGIFDHYYIVKVFTAFFDDCDAQKS